MNGTLAKAEFEAYRKDDAEARAILDLATEEKRSTTPEEDARFDQLLTSAQVHKARSDKLIKSDADQSELAETIRSRYGAADDDSGKPGDKPSWDDKIVETFRSMKEAVQRGGTIPSEIGVDVPEDRDETIRAISDFANGTSLYTSDFRTRIAVFQRTMSPWISQGEVINADNGRPMILPNLSVDPTSYTNGEATAITASDPTLGTATITPVGYKALTLLSQEAEEDELVGLLGIIAKVQGRSLGLKFGTDATAAVLGATNGGTAGGLGGGSTATFFGYEDLLDLKYGAASPYRLVGAWVMANGAIKKVRKFTDKNGQYLWQPSLAPGQPDTFDGQAVYEDPALATPASATKSVVYGDLSAFVIKQMPLRVATSSDYLFNTDQLAIKSVWRVSGAVADVAALRYLVSANA